MTFLSHLKTKYFNFFIYFRLSVNFNSYSLRMKSTSDENIELMIRLVLKRTMTSLKYEESTVRMKTMRCKLVAVKGNKIFKYIDL